MEMHFEELGLVAPVEVVQRNLEADPLTGPSVVASHQQLFVSVQKRVAANLTAEHAEFDEHGGGGAALALQNTMLTVAAGQTASPIDDAVVPSILKSVPTQAIRSSAQ